MAKKNTNKEIGVVCPSKYIMYNILDDDSINYPIVVSILGNGGSSTHSLTKDELKEAVTNPQFFINSVLRMKIVKGTAYLDLMQKSYYKIPENIIKNELFPALRNGSVLTVNQADMLYKAVMHVN